ncbi:EF-P lysine aminoacylase EpmA [Marinobacter xestospongiae]|uniref:EF-P lysine aminoacylase EpmA n=1 Tax=Marinobacter xestospongiae TaxID=994319 RepID=A0ABU3VU12_9GAMM|nr:EF-P lysine aminoacylase EpmA [Marinobacter xestospongiae]MDV2077756.1 EF-P lysine aminoacylase EpmA [Marinobacter xestospongiae]
MTANERWQPTASLADLQARALQLAYLRDFFARRGVLEVETPVLGRHGVTDLNLDSIAARFAPIAGDSCDQGWLQTSPEYHMKRLLAAGSGSIFQVFRAFRSGERGHRHNPEFSLLEWYRPGFTDLQLMAEVADLVCDWLGCSRPEVLSYRAAMQCHAGIDPFTVADEELVQRCGAWVGESLAASLDRDTLLELVMSHQVEVALAGEAPTFIHQYPASQAALARISQVDGFAVAHRFELYIGGLELCNGYWELTDPDEQRARFEADNRARQAQGKPAMPVDEELLAALSAGLPDCAGVALGLDRLLMLKQGRNAIDDVVAFPLERA